MSEGDWHKHLVVYIVAQQTWSEINDHLPLYKQADDMERWWEVYNKL